MELTHAGDDGLARLFIRIGLEGRILLRQLLQRYCHLLLTGFGLGLDGDADNGLGEFHGFKDDRSLFITESVAGGGVLQADCGRDITGVDHAEVFSVVCVHEQDAPDSLTLTLG